MKKTLFIALLGMMMLALTSCNKEENMILGTWVTTLQCWTHVDDPDVDVHPEHFLVDGLYTYQFKDNGKYTDAITSLLNGSWEPEEHSYSIENGKINLEREGIFEIQELTKNKLVLHRDTVYASDCRYVIHYEFVKK